MSGSSGGEPEHITRWCFTSDDWHCQAGENDLRTGGKFSSRMEARDGRMGFDFDGTYTAVVAQREISYSMTDGRQVTTLFTESGRKTRVITSFDPEQVLSAEMQRAGWQAILDNFRKYAADAAYVVCDSSSTSSDRSSLRNRGEK